MYIHICYTSIVGHNIMILYVGKPSHNDSLCGGPSHEFSLCGVDIT